MDALVVLEVDGMAEGLVALLALEGLLPAVDELVCPECDGPREALAAVAAHKHLLACVREGVAVEVLRQVEASAAHVAAVRLLACVDDGMRLQLRLLGEGLAALGTLVRALARVRPSVTPQSLLLAEGPAAGATGEGRLTRVGALVSLQVALGREGLAARRTLKVLPRDALEYKARHRTVIPREVGGHRLVRLDLSACSTNRSCQVLFTVRETSGNDRLLTLCDGRQVDVSSFIFERNRGDEWGLRLAGDFRFDLQRLTCVRQRRHIKGQQLHCSDPHLGGLLRAAALHSGSIRVFSL